MFGIVISRLKSALSNADERFAAVLEGLDAAVYVADDDTNEVLYANEKFRKAFPEGSKPPSLAYGQREGELQHRKSGRWYLVHARPMRWIDGRIVTLHLATDITQRRNAEVIFRQQQEKMQMTARLVTVGEMATTIAHELNQPLAAIVTNGSACLRWLDREVPDLGEAIQSVHRMVRDANRAGEVIAHTRALMKKSGGEKSALDVTRMIREILPVIELEVRRQEVVVRESLAEDLPPVLGARVELQQVVLNLVMNGIEAMADVSGRARELVITSERHQLEDGPAVLVSVQDAGIGVAQENLGRLFEAFYTTKPHGLGMGLPISRSIAQAHGGRLWATRNPGHGLTFQLALPAWSPPGS